MVLELRLKIYQTESVWCPLLDVGQIRHLQNIKPLIGSPFIGTMPKRHVIGLHSISG